MLYHGSDGWRSGISTVVVNERHSSKKSQRRRRSSTLEHLPRLHCATPGLGLLSLPFPSSLLTQFRRTLARHATKDHIMLTLEYTPHVRTNDDNESHPIYHPVSRTRGIHRSPNIENIPCSLWMASMRRRSVASSLPACSPRSPVFSFYFSEGPRWRKRVRSLRASPAY